MVIALTIFLFFVTFGVLLFLFDSFFGGLDFSSGQPAVKQVANFIKQKHLEKSNFYDLGCARGGFAIRIARIFPRMKITGIDNSSFRSLFAKIRSSFLNNLIFKKTDIFSANISSADVAYIYLPQELMPALQEKLQKELKPGSVVISNKVYFPTWQPIEKHQQLFIYAKS